MTRSVLRTVIAVLLAGIVQVTCLYSPSHAAAKMQPEPDEAISIFADDNSQEDCVIFSLRSRRTIESTVTFRCDEFSNLKPNKPLPFTTVVTEPGETNEFLRLQQDEPGKHWSYGHWSFQSKLGAKSELATVDYAYALPFPAGQRHQVIQSWHGKFSHYEGSQSEYAVDFEMPEGNVVTACRPGTVIGYRADSDVGGRSEKFRRSDNYVVIKHGDGTYGSYAHFQHNGVLVKLGQSIAEGDKLGLSGATGWADRPHLHFAVYRVIDGSRVESVPFRFKVGNTTVRHLIEGQIY